MHEKKVETPLEKRALCAEMMTLNHCALGAVSKRSVLLLVCGIERTVLLLSCVFANHCKMILIPMGRRVLREWQRDCRVGLIYTR